MALKKVAKKRAAKKKVRVDPTQKLKGDHKAAKAEGRELKKQVTAAERQVKALLGLLEKTQADTTRFLGDRVKEAVAKHGVVVPRKKRAKKKVARK